jgi:hypothetical protein
MSGPSAKIILQPSRNSKPSSNTLLIKPALRAGRGEENHRRRIRLNSLDTGTHDHRGTNCLNSVWPIVKTLMALPLDDVEKSALRGVLGIFVVIVATNDPFR